MAEIKAGPFAPRLEVAQVEEGTDFAPKFDKDGLIPVVTTDFHSGEVLMHAYMNATALLKTVETGQAHYWSRSRKALWRKGEVSGFVQEVREMLVDDDQDALWLRVIVAGTVSCHVGYRSCFYRKIPVGKTSETIQLQRTIREKLIDPETVYGGQPNPTQL